MKQKDITLVKDKDGIYVPKGTNFVRNKLMKYDKSDADEFLSGIDMGLNFVEQLDKYVKRINKL